MKWAKPWDEKKFEWRSEVWIIPVDFGFFSTEIDPLELHDPDALDPKKKTEVSQFRWRRTPRHDYVTNAISLNDGTREFHFLSARTVHRRRVTEALRKAGIRFGPKWQTVLHFRRDAGEPPVEWYMRTAVELGRRAMPDGAVVYSNWFAPYGDAIPQAMRHFGITDTR